MRSTALAVLALSATAAFGSEPGQPLDCSDWVFLEPGLSCRVVVDQCGPTVPHEACYNWPGKHADNAGGLLWIRQHNLYLGECPDGGRPTARIEVSRILNGVWGVVAYVQERCGNPAGVDRVQMINAQDGQVGFEGNNGRLLLGLETGSGGSGLTPRLVAIEGFATTFDILQTFTPSASAVGFRVPYMPEGLAAADRFDTFYGPLTHPIDFAAAQSLACDYPAAAPAVGDYLEVPASLPDPPTGQGHWYLTAVTYQGQTRFGRKASGGTLSGREPGGFPVCAGAK